MTRVQLSLIFGLSFLSFYRVVNVYFGLCSLHHSSITDLPCSAQCQRDPLSNSRVQVLILYALPQHTANSLGS
ncbi:hypothetical protein F4778DRAFT_723310 [Xylariomycetidae sp. FL2044]|nr:hypothetical protein F4778DRAFT_723310 [Xylariomycetidae sp. FL2044]